MTNSLESGLQNILSYIAVAAKQIFGFLKSQSEPILKEGVQKIEPAIVKSKEFYQEHKEVVLIVGAASLTYLIMRPRDKEEEKGKKKKGAVMKSKLNKSFISDDSAEGFKDEPSTTVKVQSSGRQVLKKKNQEKRILERISSSSESEQGDKIFFEMYENYKKENSEK